jgi:hypothetical protein
MKIYAVCVFKQGTQQGRPINVEAHTALEAMDEVEARLGLKKPKVSINQSTGTMSAIWHGFEFRARALA